MPRGIKETSGIIVVSAEVTETAANTFTATEVDLNLDPLNNEVAVIYAIDLDLQEGDMVDGVNTVIRGSLSTTSRTTVGDLSQSNVMATERMVIQNDGTNAIVTGFSSGASQPATTLDYLGIIATPDFFLNLQGTSQANAKSMFAKIYLKRARADSAIYAALVQSELLS
jgi:hypothetical protein